MHLSRKIKRNIVMRNESVNRLKIYLFLVDGV